MTKSKKSGLSRAARALIGFVVALFAVCAAGSGLDWRLCDSQRQASTADQSFRLSAHLLTPCSRDEAGRSTFRAGCSGTLVHAHGLNGTARPTPVRLKRCTMRVRSGTSDWPLPAVLAWKVHAKANGPWLKHLSPSVSSSFVSSSLHTSIASTILRI